MASWLASLSSVSSRSTASASVSWPSSWKASATVVRAWLPKRSVQDCCVHCTRPTSAMCRQSASPMKYRNMAISAACSWKCSRPVTRASSPFLLLTPALPVVATTTTPRPRSSWSSRARPASASVTSSAVSSTSCSPAATRLKSSKPCQGGPMM
ncbi:hypothetical protein D3C78_1337600 [compost metagenome]